MGQAAQLSVLTVYGGTPYEGQESQLRKVGWVCGRVLTAGTLTWFRSLECRHLVKKWACRAF